MDEWLNSPQFWVSSIVSGLVGVLATFLAFLLIRAKGPFYSLLSKAQGRFKKFARNQRSKSLRVVKSIRFDSSKVGREIVRSYCVLGLFGLGIAITIVNLMLAPTDIHKSQLAVVLYISVTAIPTLILEWAWLNASTRANQVLRYRSKIKRKGRRMV